MKTKLCVAAVTSADYSYSKYSGFRVGAALLCSDGSVYTGANIENASFSATVCAERTAFFKAVSEGKRDFVSIAVAGGRETVGKELCCPCGVCRQVMAEFCDPDKFTVLLVKEDGYEEYTLRELLPHSFSL